MNRAVIAQLALRVYPSEDRDRRGAEIVGTLLDASDGSVRALSLELGSILRGGLAARVLEAARQPSFRLILESVAWAGMALWILVAVTLWRFGPPELKLQLWPFDLLLVPALFAVGFRRAAGLLGVYSLIAHGLTISYQYHQRLFQGPHPDHPPVMTVSYPSALIIAAILAGFIAASVLAPRTRPSWPIRFSRLAMVAGFALALYTMHYSFAAWAVVAALAVMALPVAPALTLGLTIMSLIWCLRFILTGNPIAEIGDTKVVLLMCQFPAAIILIGLLRRSSQTR